MSLIEKTQPLAHQDSHGEKHNQETDRQDDMGTDVPHPLKKRKHKNRAHHLLHQSTLRKPAWTYFHLRLFSPSSDEPLDMLTAKKYLNAALQRFLGLHGLAIPVDILKLEEYDIWIRVPREDGNVSQEALSGWVGDGVKWTVKERDDWLVRLASGGNGHDLFRT